MIQTDTEKMIMSRQRMAHLGMHSLCSFKSGFITVSTFMSFKDADREKISLTVWKYDVYIQMLIGESTAHPAW